jgi:hypothetical protein
VGESGWGLSLPPSQEVEDMSTKGNYGIQSISPINRNITLGELLASLSFIFVCSLEKASKKLEM